MHAISHVTPDFSAAPICHHQPTAGSLLWSCKQHRCHQHTLHKYCKSQLKNMVPRITTAVLLPGACGIRNLALHKYATTAYRQVPCDLFGSFSHDAVCMRVPAFLRCQAVACRPGNTRGVSAFIVSTSGSVQVHRKQIFK